MLTLELAQLLKSSGLGWTPASGDRFVVPVSDMEEQAFVLSDITADIHRFTSGDVIVRLEQVTGGYAVTATSAGGVEGRFVDIDAERAYARALLARLRAPR